MKFLSEPYLLTLNASTEMNIVWIQSEKMDGVVEFGTTEDLGQTISTTCYEITGLHGPLSDGTFAATPEECPQVLVYQHIAKLENLTPGQTIFYRCKSGDKVTQIYDFHTAPESGKEFKFAQLSDLQGLGNCHETVYKIGCQHPDFILYSGDATYISWRLDQWFDVGEDWQDEDTRKKAFFPCMQQQNGARLLQYAPMFFCPGNHELDDGRVYQSLPFCLDDTKWNWSIFMQILRPLYPDTDTGLNGTRWYSADYSDMHIASLNINRFFWWPYDKEPGWRIYDSIDPADPQVNWLRNDLKNNNSKFKWVIQHFHILTQGQDVQFNMCNPVLDGKGNASYPYDHGGMLMDLFSETGVNGVTFGHSHVYERYYRKSTHFIEAAYLSICYRRPGENPPPHPSGLLPIVVDNSRRSFLMVERKKGGLFATGYYADGDEPIPFDQYQIADEDGNSVPPPTAENN